MESQYGFDGFTGSYDPGKLRIYGSLSLYTKDKKYSIEEKVDYVPENSSGYSSWFNGLTTNIKLGALSSSIVRILAL